MDNDRLLTDVHALLSNLKVGKVKGKTADELTTLLKQLQVKLIQPKTTTPAPQVTEVTTETEPTKERKHRTTPVGAWQKRERTIKLAGVAIPVTSITEAERKIFQAQDSPKNPFKKTTTAEIAKAIKEAYPENNYTEQRIISARKTWDRNKESHVDAETANDAV